MAKAAAVKDENKAPVKESPVKVVDDVDFDSMKGFVNRSEVEIDAFYRNESNGKIVGKVIGYSSWYDRDDGKLCEMVKIELARPIDGVLEGNQIVPLKKGQIIGVRINHNNQILKDCVTHNVRVLVQATDKKKIKGTKKSVWEWDIRTDAAGKLVPLPPREPAPSAGTPESYDDPFEGDYSDE